MSADTPPQSPPPMFRLLPMSEPSAYFPAPSKCRFYVHVHKRMTRRQFQLAVIYTLSTTPALRDWYFSQRSAWERRVDQLFQPCQDNQDSDESECCSICLAEGCSDSPDKKDAVKLLHDCGHAFHSKCLHLWFRHGNTSCPCCRRVINITL